MSAIPFDPPSPFYYLDNFQRVLDWVVQRYDDLLAREERTWIERFRALPQASRALLVRMVLRKGGVFRTGKLRYAEIGCPDRAAAPLVEQGWLVRDPVLAVDEVFGLLKKAEIAAAFGLGPREQALRKPELLEALRPAFLDPRPFSAWHAQAGENVYQVAVAAWCERLRLLFFGNLYQDWSEFVLSDLGIYRYEQVAFSPSSRGFSRRRDVDDYLHLQRCRERLDQGDAPDAILADVPGAPFENDWLEGRRNKLLFRLAQQYERAMRFEDAAGIYRRCAHPGARLREIRMLERCGQMGAAHGLAQIARQAPESEAEQQALQRMLPRLRRKSGAVAQADEAPVPGLPAVEHIDLVLPYPDSAAARMATVEQLVCAHYSCEQAPVLYVENALINSLFGLLCWSAVFAPLPGAFFHPFQPGPADLHSPDFHRRRAGLFAQCLAQLDGGEYRQTILDNFHAKQGMRSPFVFWSMLDEALLTLALDCLPAPHLAKLFERILRDVRANRSGFPDLIQFWPEEGHYRMLEVKGPGDRLQDNQRRWLDYCAAHGMPVAVCYVRWEEEAG